MTVQTEVLSNEAGSKSIDTADMIDGSAKAWCVFDGSGTPAILASFGASSITDIGVGNFEVNLTTPMLDANYSATATSSAQCTFVISSTRTVSVVPVRTRDTDNANVDAVVISVAVHR